MVNKTNFKLIIPIVFLGAAIYMGMNDIQYFGWVLAVALLSTIHILDK